MMSKKNRGLSIPKLHPQIQMELIERTYKE